MDPDQTAASGDDDDLDALLSELGGDAPPAPEAKEEPVADVDLDSLLAELGGGESEASAIPAEEAPPAPAVEADADLDALLSELGATEPESSTPEAAASESGSDDLDALLAELGGADSTEATAASTVDEAPADAEVHAEEAVSPPRVETPKPTTVAPPTSKKAPPPVARVAPEHAFDKDDEPPRPGPGWSRFSKSGYSGAKKSEGSARSRPWKKTEDSANGDAAPEGKAGWNKLKRGPDGKGGDASGPSAGWDKLRR